MKELEAKMAANANPHKNVNFFRFIRNHQPLFIAVLLLLISYPFSLLGLGDLLILLNKNIELKELYTFNQPIKEFITGWVAFWGLLGVAFSIIQMNARISKMDEQNQIQLQQQKAQQKRWEEQDTKEKLCRDEQSRKDKELREEQYNQFTEQIKKQDEQIKLQEKQQRDARFASGVELLGNINESARIGGAYNLYFLAKEYIDDYLNPVCEILCAHIRTITSNEEYREKYKATPSNEIQTILNLLFLEDNGEKIFSYCSKNLSKTFLSGVNCSYRELNIVNFCNAILIDVNFKNTQFYKVRFNDATLSKVNFEDAHFENTFFEDTIFNNVTFENVSFEEIDFENANLTNVNFGRARLLEVNFVNASLSNVFFYDTFFVIKFTTILREISFVKTKISNVSFEGAELFNINFENAELVNVNFMNTLFNNVNFKGTVLDNYNDEDITREKYSLELTTKERKIRKRNRKGKDNSLKKMPNA